MALKEAWFDLNDAEFDVKIQNWYKKMRDGAYLKSTRKARVQAAIDYGSYRANAQRYSDPSLYSKYIIMRSRHADVFRESAPNPNPRFANLSRLEGDLVLVLAREAMLKEKKELLEFWADGFKSEGWLQGAEDYVQDTLFRLVDDAEVLCNGTDQSRGDWLTKWYTTEARTWAGSELEAKKKWHKQRVYRAIEGSVEYQGGVSASGALSIEFKGLKARVEGGVKAGLFASASGKAEIGRKDPTVGDVVSAVKSRSVDGLLPSVNVEGQAEVSLGVTLTAGAELDIYDIVSVKAKGSAFAGAMANAKAKFTISAKGVNFSASASAFAGVKADGALTGTVKFGGRDICTLNLTGSVSAGAGASGQFAFQASLTGSKKVSFGASATLGVGVGSGVGFEYNLDALALSGAEWFAKEVRQALVRRELRYELMTGDEANAKVHKRATDRIEELLAEVEKERDALENQIAPLKLGLKELPAQQDGYAKLL